MVELNEIGWISGHSLMETCRVLPPARNSDVAALDVRDAAVAAEAVTSAHVPPSSEDLHTSMVVKPRDRRSLTSDIKMDKETMVPEGWDPPLNGIVDICHSTGFPSRSWMLDTVRL